MIARRRFLRHSLSVGALALGVGCNCLTSTALASTLSTKGSSTEGSSTKSSSPKLPTAKVFRSANCGCCGSWVEHLQAAGFTVSETITEELEAVKQEYGVPDELASCHTAIVDGYVIEGHVPAEDVIRLLAEKPEVVGLAVPGMPIGSPGMEMNDEQESYAVLSFKDGAIETFAEHA